MKKRLCAFVLGLSIVAPGCHGPRVDTVPWWKGLPAMVIAPSSLEAMAWRDAIRDKRAARHGHPAHYGAPGYAHPKWSQSAHLVQPASCEPCTAAVH